MKYPQESLMLVGCGNMGSALLKGILQGSLFYKEIHIVSPNRATVEPFLTDSRIQWHSSPPSSSAVRPGIIILAVKPHLLAELLPLYQPFVSPECVYLSVAVAVKMDTYKQHLGNTARIVRAMPNTPTAIGEGITLVYTENALPPAQQQFIEQLLKTLGDVFWMPSEEKLDQATVLTGCGPAYLYRFIESLAHGLEQFGFNAGEAQDFSQKMVLGAAHYLIQSNTTPATLRAQVTSKNGVTEAALSVLEQDQALDRLFENAFHTAYQRTLEMQK